MRYQTLFLGLAIYFLTTQSSVPKERNPALKTLVNISSEVFVAKVMKTSPTIAIEGARDTVILQVKNSLKGNLKKGQRIEIYYHLLWKDTTKWILEDKKFEAGKEYVIFTYSYFSDNDKKTKYELTDRWLSVQKPHPKLIEEIRTKHKQLIKSDQQ